MRKYQIGFHLTNKIDDVEKKSNKNEEPKTYIWLFNLGLCLIYI